MNVLGVALLEVMDKEASVPWMWFSFLVLGAAALSLGRRSLVGSLCVAALAVLVALGQYGEMTDPVIGPAIRREAGDAYFVHGYTSMVMGLAMCAAGVAWALARRMTRRAAVDAPAR